MATCWTCPHFCGPWRTCLLIPTLHWPPLSRRPFWVLCVTGSQQKKVLQQTRWLLWPRTTRTSSLTVLCIKLRGFGGILTLPGLVFACVVTTMDSAVDHLMGWLYNLFLCCAVALPCALRQDDHTCMGQEVEEVWSKLDSATWWSTCRQAEGGAAYGCHHPGDNQQNLHLHSALYLKFHS